VKKVFAVGIDLGTTNSAVAYVTEAGQTVMLPNELGELTTPSTVHFDTDGVVVGRQACKALLFDPQGVAECAKRDVGRSHCEQAVHGRQFPPEVVQACILKHFKDLLASHLPGSYGIVITVPAFFDELRRKSVADAARMAGLEILDIVNEPTAAALAYGEHHGYLTVSGAPREDLTLLVYDLGGGTFDVTLIQLQPGRIRTLATDGDVRLGGRDWDERLADYAAQKFEAQFRMDPRDDPVARARLRRLAEEAKQTLSVRQKAIIPVDLHGARREVVVTRDQFEALTSDLLERTAHTTRQVLQDAGLSWDRIDKVLLSGGSTRMPMVTRMLEQFSGRVPDRTINPDEAVARGAAIYASFLLAQRGFTGHPLRFHVIDVNSHSLGIEGVDPHTGRRENTILIPRNTPLPTSVTHRFVTKEWDQTSVVIKVLEGESRDPRGCITIGTAVLRDLPDGLRKGHPIEVIYHYEPNGRLVVSLELPGTDRRLEMELQRAGSLSDDRIRHWQTVVGARGGFFDFERALEEVLGVRLKK
jgi:molecular chaperone DnaK